MMARQTKPKSKPKVRSNDRKPSSYSSLWRQFRAVSHYIFARIKTSPGLALVWLKSRPEAVKKWREARKKRKMYRSFHLQKKLKNIHKPIPSSWKIFKDSWKFLFRNKGKMLFLVIIYGIIYILFLAPKANTGSADLIPIINKVVGSNGGVDGTLIKFGSTIGIGLLSSGSTSAANVLVGLAMSLIFIWAIRHLVNKRKIKIRDAIYQGLGPFIPFVIVLFIIALECIPAFVMSFLYTTAKSSNLLTTGVENFVFFAILAVVILLCLYWATSSIMALYISTLPGMYPFRALKSAKKLVAFRRFQVFRRIVALPIWLLIVYGSILVIIASVKTAWLMPTIDVMTVVTLPLFHTYMYKIYRSLL